ncbi:MAG: LuxR C-terminal-related transcriptional regulator [Clostridiales bacterium]|nr:LuxR C-terminal-related transcriptional regulator [Clostridiales bacterium]
MIKLTPEQWNIINEAIYTMNAESNLDKLRGDVLAALDSLIPHARSFFDLGRRQNNQVDFFDPLARNMEKRFLDLYYDEFQYIDTMFWFFSQNRTEVYRESDFVSTAMQEASAFYSGWLAPQNIHYSMGSMVVHNGILYGSVNLWRSKSQGDFSDEEVQIMAVVNRHLSLRFGNWFPKGFHKRGTGSHLEPLARLFHLTHREIEIAELIFEGLSIREIADVLFVTENTVKKHTSHIFKKMNVDSRARLARAVRSHIEE